MSKHIQGIELTVIPGRRGYAPDIIWNPDTNEQVAAVANPDLTALFAAAPEMLELLAEIRDHPLIPRCGFDDCKDCTLGFAAQIDALLAKIEGGEAK
jgi:hypothetical protein